MRGSLLGILVVLLLLGVAAGPAAAKVPSEILVQGVGLPYATRIADDQTRMRLMELLASSSAETPATGAVLSYHHVVYFIWGTGSPAETESRYFYQPGSGASPGYAFIARYVTVNDGGDEQAYVWTTLYRPAGLDALLEPYLDAEASEAQYLVGDPPPSVVPPREILDPGEFLSISPAFLIVAVVAAAILGALVFRLPQRARAP